MEILNNMDWFDEVKKPYPILIIDDSEEDKTILRIKTRNFHRELIEVSSSEEALKLLETRQDIKLIILDERLPHMDGLELFKVLHVKYPKIKIIFLTGYAGEFVNAVSKIAFASVVAKPLESSGEFWESMMMNFDIPRVPTTENPS